MRRLLLGLTVVLLGCPIVPSPVRPTIASLKVTIKAPRAIGTGAPIAVSGQCQLKFGGVIPDGVAGTPDCPYAIPRGPIEIEVTATALDQLGKPLPSFTNPITFRVVPGQLPATPADRWAPSVDGVAQRSLRLQRVYGQVRIWAEDAPVPAAYAGAQRVDGGPVEPETRSFAVGLSPPISFEEPTLATLQLPDDGTNRSSPFVGEFVTIGRPPESGALLRQSCDADQERNGLPAAMVVTGTDPGGFYVSDITSCRVRELGAGNGAFEPPDPCLVPLNDGGTVPLSQWDGGQGTSGPRKCRLSGAVCLADGGCPSYYPGTFGSVYVFNNSFPEGLNDGDLLFSVGGSVQEFTSTTQLTFPSWTIGERVHTLPQAEWGKWLNQVPIVDLTYRVCGARDQPSIFLTDQLCGHNNANLKMESLESALVRIRNVRFPTDFVDCDLNGDSQVVQFCERPDERGTFIWGSCAFNTAEPPSDAPERVCNSECTTGTGLWRGHRCAEVTTFRAFGQYPVEIGGAGPSRVGLDDSLPKRIQSVEVTHRSSVAAESAPGVELNILCDGDVYFRFGAVDDRASPRDALLPKGELLNHILGPTQRTVHFYDASPQPFAPPGNGPFADLFDVSPRKPDAGSPAPVICQVAENARVRINLLTRDAVPELSPDCLEDDSEAGRECLALRRGSFDIIGHLRHVPAARPRWTVQPRSPKDLCCHPGPGLSCPRPIQPCP